MTTTTERPQHMEALDRAQRVRTARAHLRRRLGGERDGDRSRRLGAAVVRELPDEARSMTVIALLTSCRKVGGEKARRWLRGLHIGEGRRLDSLTDRQRVLLADVLERNGR